jgi:hypothetical protein
MLEKPVKPPMDERTAGIMSTNVLMAPRESHAVWGFWHGVSCNTEISQGTRSVS